MDNEIQEFNSFYFLLESYADLSIFLHGVWVHIFVVILLALSYHLKNKSTSKIFKYVNQNLFLISKSIFIFFCKYVFCKPKIRTNAPQQLRVNPLAL